MVRQPAGDILVLGVTGRVGGRVAARLVEAGCRPRCLVRDVGAAKGRLGALATKLDFAAGAMGDAASLAAALHGCDRVFLMGPIAPQMQDLQQQVVDAVAQADGLRHVVKLSGSTWTMDSRDATTSGRAHAAIEADLSATAARRGFRATMLRPGVFFDGFLQVALGRLAAAVTERPGEEVHLTLPIGDAAVAFVDPDAIADVASTALLDPSPAGGVIEVSWPEAVTGEAVAAQAAAVLGVPVRYKAVPLPQVLAAQPDTLPAFQRRHIAEMLTGIAAGRAARPAQPPTPGLAGRSFSDRLAHSLATSAEPR